MTSPGGMVSRVGFVAIGRNEGERLQRCLRSLPTATAPVVYVDSGSTDGSARRARDLGAVAVSLAPSPGFTAARARNAGLAKLLSLHPELEYVQFVDGDCELDPGWVPAGLQALDADEGLAAVCGRLRETCPDSSVYNALCDIEWDVPAGETLACGGIALMRVLAFREVGGFRADLVAGEEPELCARFRRRGFRIRRLAADMARHDAALTRFSQWWNRAARAGHAYAQGALLHASGPEHYWVREVTSILFWGLANPVAALALAAPTRGGSLLLLAGYPVLAFAIWRRHRARLGDSRALVFAAFCVGAKFPQLVGVARFAVRAVAPRVGRMHHARTAGASPVRPENKS